MDSVSMFRSKAWTIVMDGTLGLVLPLSGLTGRGIEETMLDSHRTGKQIHFSANTDWEESFQSWFVHMSEGDQVTIVSLQSQSNKSHRNLTVLCLLPSIGPEND